MRIQTSSEPIQKSEIVSWLSPYQNTVPEKKKKKKLPASRFFLERCGGLNEMSSILLVLVSGLQVMTLVGRFSRCGLAGGNMTLKMGLESLKICHHFEFIL